MNIKTPAYIFDAQCFFKTANGIKSVIGDCSLTYSMKANPILVGYIPDCISYIEVCSHGEFSICKAYGIDGKRIIYSGVLKKEKEIKEALEYGVRYITVESVHQFRMINRISCELNATSEILIRLSSGNQFGVSEDDFAIIMEENKTMNMIRIKGIHYYSGTQKKRIDLIEKDLREIDKIVTWLSEKYDYTCDLIEYGPGLAMEYFDDSREDILKSLLAEVINKIKEYKWMDKVGFEFGRVLAADSGKYVTTVCDKKTTNGINYLIVDGGIHQLRYFGQNMAMQIPPISVSSKSDNTKNYCICGSLCTVADVLVRDIEFPIVDIGDSLTFSYCGAYSSTESPALFLSRELPNIYVSVGEEVHIIRDTISTSSINSKKGGSVMELQRRNMEEVIGRIVRMIRPDIDFESEINLISDGLLESMDVVEIVAQVEDELKIVIPTYELVESNFSSLAKMIDMCLRIIGDNQNV